MQNYEPQDRGERTNPHRKAYYCNQLCHIICSVHNDELCIGLGGENINGIMQYSHKVIVHKKYIARRRILEDRIGICKKLQLLVNNISVVHAYKTSIPSYTGGPTRNRYYVSISTTTEEKKEAEQIVSIITDFMKTLGE